MTFPVARDWEERIAEDDQTAMTSPSPVVCWHGTRRAGLELARTTGFALRDPVETAGLVAGTLDLDVDELMLREEYCEAVRSFAEVDGMLSVTTHWETAVRYAQTGSGTVSDILGGAYGMLVEQPGWPVLRWDDFLTGWLNEHDPDPVIVEFSVPPSRLLDLDAWEGKLGLQDASTYATYVWSDCEVRQPF